MNKIWLIIKREYWTRVRKRSFILITLLAPLGMIFLMGIQIFLTTFNRSELNILVKDESGAFVQKDGRGNLSTVLEISPKSNLNLVLTEEPFAILKNNYRDDGYDGILYIPQIELDNPDGFEYFSHNFLGVTKKILLERRLKEVLKNIRIKNAGINRSLIDQWEKISVSLTETGETESGDSDKGSSELANILGFGMGILMYMIIIIYGTTVMKGIMEEKTNRIAEVILTSVKPFQLMVGKIVGIGMVGITQYLIWMGLLLMINYGIGMYVGQSMEMPTSIAEQASPAQDLGVGAVDITQKFDAIKSQLNKFPIGLLLGAFVFYFLGGYLLYAAMFAALGAIMGEDGESQALVMVVTTPILISFFLLFAIFEDPNGKLAFWASMIPFSSSINMPARIAFGGVSPLEIIASMILLVLGFLATTWIAARIYRLGILIYGKKISLREVWKWAFHA